MVPPKVQKLIIVAFVLLILAFLGYRIFLQSAELPVGEADLSGVAVVGQDILDLVKETERVSIDKSLFSSVLFTGLVDFEVIPTPEAQGRPDPFAPVGVDSEPIVENF